jgi:hypothetical protein
VYRVKRNLNSMQERKNVPKVLQVTVNFP